MNLAHCVSTKLIRLFDRYSVYSESLAQQGFDDFCIYAKYIESFARTEEELALSRSIRREIARRNFWADCLLSTRTLGRQLSPAPFDGDWVDQMLKEQKCALKERGELENANYLSAIDLDPCQVGEKAWSKESYKNWRVAGIELTELQLHHRDEMAAAGVVDAPPVEDNEAAIMDFVEARLLKGLCDPSYKRVKKGTRKRVIVAKSLSDSLQMRFQVYGDRWSFSRFGTRRLGPQGEVYSDPNCLHLSLSLHRRSSDTHRLSDIPEIELPFLHLAPLIVYGHYRNSAQISVAIGGWMALYRMVSKEIENACLSCWDQQSIGPT